MRYLSLFLACFFAVVASSKAQTNTYSFSQSSGTYTTVSGTTLAAGSSLLNNTYAVTLPFTFYFNGAAYTSVYVALNGYISFGNLNPYPVSDAISTSMTLNGAVAGFSGDVQGQAGTSLVVTTLGTSPNRIFVAQYTDLRQTSTINCHLSFQIRLLETDHSLQVVYGPMSSTSMSVNGQVGLRGAQNTDFYNRVTSSNWAATSSGGTNSGSCVVSSSVTPASGLTFTWTPNGCPANPAPGTASATSSTVCTGQSTQVSVSGQTGGTSIQWQTSTDSLIWTNVSGATSSSYTTPGITTTTYYRARITCNISSIFVSYTAGKKITVTSPNTTVASLPYFQSFEANPWLTSCSSDQVPDNNWVSSVSGSGSHRFIRSNSTASSSYNQGKYSPISSHGSISARFHSYAITSVGAYAQLDLYADFSQSGQKKIEFNLINPQGLDSFNVLISDNQGQTWTSLIKTKTAYTTWTAMNALSSMSNDTVIIRFKAINNSTSSSTSDLGFDNLNVYRLCTGAPTASITAPRDSACQYVADTLTVAGTLPAPDIAMYWQSRTSGSSGAFTNIAGATGNFIVVNPTVAMEYRAIVKCLTTGDSTITAIKTIYIYPPNKCYCIPKYQLTCNSSYSHISGITIVGEQGTGISDLATGCTNGYRFYTTDTAKLSAGGYYKITVLSSNTGDRTRAWLDANDDGDFSSTELIGTAGTNYSVNMNIAIPAGTPYGPHRLRIRNAGITTFQSCDSLGGSGETHDYILNITPCYNPPTGVTILDDSLGACFYDDANLIFTGINIDSAVVYPYGYTNSWSFDNITTVPVTYSLSSGNPTGLYVLEVTNRSSCLNVRDTFYLYHSFGPGISFSNPYSFCAGDTFNITPTTVDAKYYAWSNGEFTSYINIIAPGNYILTAYDKDSCAVKDTAFVTMNQPASVSSISENHLGLAYNFSGVNMQNTTSVTWLFGDGNTSTASSVSHTYANPGNYTVTLIVDNAFGCGADTATLNITVSNPPVNSVADTKNIKAIADIYPNPASDHLIVKPHSPGAIQHFRIRNAAGSIVHTVSEIQSAGQLKIDLRHLSSGLYIIEITTAGEVVTGKFTINR